MEFHSSHPQKPGKDLVIWFLMKYVGKAFRGVTGPGLERLG